MSILASLFSGITELLSAFGLFCVGVWRVNKYIYDNKCKHEEIDRRVTGVEKSAENIKECIENVEERNTNIKNLLKKFYSKFTPIEKQSKNHGEEISLLLKEIQVQNTRITTIERGLEVLTKRIISSPKDNLSIVHKVSKSREGVTLPELKSMFRPREGILISPKNRASLLIIELYKVKENVSLRELLSRIVADLYSEQDKLPQSTQSDDESSSTIN